jgi:nucleotide-binding universal stress UspA family protein
VCVDGSADSEAAIAAGAVLLPGRRAEVVHVWSPTDVPLEEARRLMEGARDPAALGAALSHVARGRSERAVERGVGLARAAGWDTTGTSRRSESGIWFEIARLAAERGAEAVVVGAGGASEAGGMLGSVSDALVHHCACPVLVVQGGTPDAVLRGGPVVIGYDASADADRAVDAAAALLPGRLALVVHAGAGGSEGVAELGAGRARNAGMSAMADARIVGPTGGSAAVGAALAAAAAAAGAAAIVVGSRGRSAVKELLLGSVAMAVLRAARGPILVVPSRSV